jgi:hypothetical protein
MAECDYISGARWLTSLEHFERNQDAIAIGQTVGASSADGAVARTDAGEVAQVSPSLFGQLSTIA